MNPSTQTRLRAEWAPSIPRELLAGAVATFALIPEVIAFSFVAGVDPSVGLFASFVISMVIAFTGGRSAIAKATSPAARPAGPTLAADFFVGVHSIRHMSSRNDSRHCGSGKRYKNAAGLRQANY